MSGERIKPVLRYGGGKYRIAPWICQYLPPHRRYVEPFMGACAVLLSKQPSRVEIVNDKESRLVNFFTVLRDRPEELADALQWTPWARDEYMLGVERAEDPLEDARRFAVRCWQGVGSMLTWRTGWYSNSNQRMPRTGQWGKLPERLLMAAERLKNVAIENDDAFAVIERYDRPDTVFYIDPPYYEETVSRPYYNVAFTSDEHERLLDVLLKVQGMVLLSGYSSPLYEEKLAGWPRRMKATRDMVGNEREEVLWLSPSAIQAQPALPGL